MQVVLSPKIEDDGTLTYVKHNEELDNIFYVCTAEDIKKILHKLDDDYLVDELEARGYTITQNEK